MMNDATVKGTVHLVQETKTFGQKGFRKRLVVLEQDRGRFTNYIPIDFVHEGCDKADDLNVGDEVEVPCRLSGRKWQRDERSEVKFFLSAEATDFTILNKSGGANDGEAPQYSESEAPFEDDDEPPF
jgi:hypothetical protein